MAPRDEKTVDNIFAGCLDNLPPLSSKVTSATLVHEMCFCLSGCPHIHKLNLHGHVDGEKHLDGVGLPKDQGILQGATWPRISSENKNCIHRWKNYEYFRLWT